MRDSAKAENLLSGIAAAWRNRSSIGERAQGKLQRQFLPAALEIQEQPPSPTGRALMWLLAALFTLAVLWAALGEVDIVVTAPGRVIASGQIKLVQAPEAGTVVTIHAREGERVEAGQALISLDPTYADADDLRIAEQLQLLSVQAGWRQALELWLDGGMGGVPELRLPPGLSRTEQALASAVYARHREEIAARMLAFEKELAANAAEQASVAAQERKTQAILAVLAQRVAAYGTLVERQYGARVQYLEMLQQHTELERSIPVLASRQQQLTAMSAAIAARMQASAGELRKHNLMELARLASEQSALEQDSRKAMQRHQRMLITSPVTGTVQELSVHTIGAVVSPAQALLKVVPEEAVIEVEALLQNRDVGFAREGQLAEVKVDTFNFTKYGVIEAEVVAISKGAVQHPELGWVFTMRLRLARDHIAVADRLVTLSPGMAITAEVKTGKRRLIEFFLSPLLRYRQESLRER